MELTEIRKKIDVIDDQMLELFLERMSLAEEIAAYNKKLADERKARKAAQQAAAAPAPAQPAAECEQISMF